MVLIWRSDEICLSALSESAMDWYLDFVTEFLFDPCLKRLVVI